MANDEILARIDQHMARGNELMSGVRAEIALHREESARNREEFAKSREERRDLRQFVREMTRRNEHVMKGLAAEAAAGRRVLVDMHHALVDLTEVSRAQRGAILTMIDELRRHGLGRRD